MAQEIDRPSFPVSESGNMGPVATFDRGLNVRKSGFAAAFAAMIVVTACEEEVPYSTYGQQEQAGVLPGLKVTKARMVLGPVAGNPAAIYMDIAYSGDSFLAITGAKMDGADEIIFHQPAPWDKNEMVKANDVSVKKGETITFAPGGKHLMVMSPPADLKPGSKTKVTLKIAGARTHDVEVEVLAAGDER